MVRGYLSSAAMVGRQREARAVRSRVLRAAKGRGGGIVLTGDSGAGKSRLLREAQLEAKLAGCLVARAASEASARGPYGVLEQLARSIFAAAPAIASETARPLADTLVIALPGLALELGPGTARGVQVDPGEERMRMQRALLDWLHAVAARQPLVLVVDDIQRCDEASCAVFAALLRENERRPLLTVLAQRTGEEVRAEAARDVVLEASKVTVLAGLDAASLKELLIGLFGDVPNVERLALLSRRPPVEARCSRRSSRASSSTAAWCVSSRARGSSSRDASGSTSRSVSEASSSLNEKLTRRSLRLRAPENVVLREAETVAVAVDSGADETVVEAAASRRRP